MKPKAINGTYYWRHLYDARAWAESHGWPTDRCIRYDAGFALQAGPSGTYAGPGENETPRFWDGHKGYTSAPV